MTAPAGAEGPRGPPGPISKILVRPFQRFFRLESASGIVLLTAALAALAWANSPLAGSYFRLWASPVTVDLGILTISKSLLLWINDGLMAIFFFVVGLEIKREVLVGELSDPKKAALAVAAALGGMLVPAALYFAVNPGGAGVDGWGIPMATDIAFALGVLALLGRRAPLALKVFVTAVAIVDDLGAVLVIAVFYTPEVSFRALAAAGLVLVVLLLMNRSGVRRTWPYAVLGILLWLAFLKSGIHATVAGVLLALTIPARRLLDTFQYVERADALLDRFRHDMKPGQTEPTPAQQDVLLSLEQASQSLETPLQRLEHGLHPWVAFLVIPVFALANAGVGLAGGLGEPSTRPVVLGVVLGLLVGKQAGILGFAWLATRLGLASLPARVTWLQIWGVGLLCGIGFTMSLFIASLAFAEAALLDAAKIGILGGSLLSGLAGAIVITWASRRQTQRTAAPASPAP